MARVAVIFAGLFRGTPATAVEYDRVVVQPLLTAGFLVDAYAAGYARDEGQWQQWLALSNSSSTTFAALNDTTNSARVFFTRCAQDHHDIFMHLQAAWVATQQKAAYDYVIKTRNDVNYGPGQFVKPCWLRGLNDNTILVNDKELHQGDRWNERGLFVMAEGWTQQVNMPPKTPWMAQQTAPWMLSDQFLIGTPASVSQVLTLASATPNNGTTCREGNGFWEWMGADYPGGPEAYIADFLYRRKIAWYTISMQVARAPSTDFIRSPCRLCYDCVQGDPFSL